jgi:hypothetical protein
MFERLIARAEEQARSAQRRIIERLALRELPPDVGVERFGGGLRLIGKRLKQRMIKDINLRNFWR